MRGNRSPPFHSKAHIGRLIGALSEDNRLLQSQFRAYPQLSTYLPYSVAPAGGTLKNCAQLADMLIIDMAYPLAPALVTANAIRGDLNEWRCLVSQERRGRQDGAVPTDVRLVRRVCGLGDRRGPKPTTHHHATRRFVQLAAGAARVKRRDHSRYSPQARRPRYGLRVPG